MASGNDQTIHEIFADNDSENEDEFEGFDPEDIYILTWIYIFFSTKLWNELPNHIRLEQNLNQFSKLLNTWNGGSCHL